MQLIVQTALIEKIKLPANAMTLTVFIIEVASFDLLPTDDIDEELYYFPEEDPFSQNFD